MKKPKLLFGILIVFLILSCSSDDNNNSNNEQTLSELIIGEWNYISQTINGTQTNFEDECQLVNEYQIYLANGTYEHTEFDNPNGTGCEQIQSTIANWGIEEETLAVSLSGQVAVTAEILELNNDTLEYRITNQDANGDGNNDVWVIIMEKRN